jgi:membrane protease YdiL (CAAX protease family)
MEEPKITKNSHVTWGPIAAILVSFLIYFISQYSAAVVILIYPLIKHWDMTQISAWLEQSAIAQFFNIALVEALAIFLLWAFLRYRKTDFKAIGWNRRPKWEDLAYMFAGFGAYFVSLNFILVPVLKWLIPALNFEQKQDIGFVSAHGPALILVFISLALLPPLVEETLVRGFLYTGLRTKLPVYAATIITSIIFAIAHLQLGNGQPALWIAAIDTFTLSLFLVYLRQKTGSLYAPVGLHFLKNSLAFLAIFVFHIV